MCETLNLLVASSNIRGSRFFFFTSSRLIYNFYYCTLELLFVVFPQVFAKRSIASVYVLKYGLHYLATFKFLQRIIFACLTKEFLMYNFIC